MIKILLYTDYRHSNVVTYNRLRDLQNVEVHYCDAQDILKGCLSADIGVLVMPGGADLYYCEKLNGAGNVAIRTYVEGGGAYLGICAGAYYGCASIGFAEHTPDQAIRGARELGFHHGTATGPIFEYLQNNDFNQSWDGLASLSYQGLDGQGRDMKCLYRGGPVFSEDQGETVLARYSDLESTPAAIIECSVGRGRVILCSPHLEFNSKTYRNVLYSNQNASYAYEALHIKTLAEYDEMIHGVFDDIISRLIGSDT